MIERRIKELAIALEALSRIQGYDAMQHYNAVSSMLGKTITEAKGQLHTTDSHDDIPF